MGAQQISGFTANVNGRKADVYAWPVLQLGLTAGGIFVPMLVDGSGSLVPSSAGGNVTVVGPLGAQAPAASVAVVPAKVTQTPGNLAASATINIPVGSVGWAVVCFTGTISITVGANAATALPAGFSASDPNIVGTQIAVTAASASTGYVQFGT